VRRKLVDMHLSVKAGVAHCCIQVDCDKALLDCDKPSLEPTTTTGSCPRSCTLSFRFLQKLLCPKIHRKLRNAFVLPFPSPTLALLLSSCRLRTLLPRPKFVTCCHCQYQRTIYSPLSVFRLMDSLVASLSSNGLSGCKSYI